MHASSKPSPRSPLETAALRLEEIEKATKRAKKGAILSTAAVLATYVASRVVDDPAASLMTLAYLASMCVGVMYAGRWSLALQLENKILGQARQQQEIDWSDIPEGSGAREIRMYASLDEARERGWKMGPDAGMINATAIPAWIELEGDRFCFDGLTNPRHTSFVPDNVRILGRLRFVLKEDSKPVAEGKSPTIPAQA